MWIYTFYVRLLIKQLPSFSRGQLNNFSIVHIYIYMYISLCVTVSLPFSEAYIPTRNAKGNIVPHP